MSTTATHGGQASRLLDRSAFVEGARSALAQGRLDRVRILVRSQRRGGALLFQLDYQGIHDGTRVLVGKEIIQGAAERIEGRPSSSEAGTRAMMEETLAVIDWDLRVLGIEVEILYS